MTEVLTPQLWAAMAAAALAGIVRGFSGFGAAMMMAPVFTVLFVPAQGVATMVCLGLVATAQLLPGAVRAAEWRQVVPLATMAALTIPLGAYVVLTVDPVWMRRGISLLVLALAGVLISGWRLRRRPGLLGALTAGALSGGLNGAAGVGGPPVILYLMAGPGSAAANRANLITYYAFLGGGTLISLALHGVVTPVVLWRVACLAPVHIAALWAGSRLFHRSTDALYRRVALTLLVGAALFGLFAR